MKTKVYGTRLSVGKAARAPNGSCQVRCVVATTSWTEAAKAFGVTLGQLRAFASITGNATEIAVASAKPGVPFWFDEHGDKQWREYAPPGTLAPASSALARPAT
jgi:hypothetical protein